MSDFSMDGNTTTVPSQNMTLTVTELNNKMAMTLLPAMIFVGVLMIVGLVGNAVVWYVFARRMPKGTQNFLVICLAVFDLLSCTVAMPTEIVDMRQAFTFESETACKILRFVNVFIAISSIFTLLAIAVDRYKNVLHPFQRQMSLRTAQRALIFIIIGALLFSWPALVLYGIHHVEMDIPGLQGRDCSTSDAARETVYPLIYNIVQFLGFACITVILVVIYVRILRETRRHYKYLRDTSDFYYVSGAVARSETSPKITLISDSRLNLHDYFVREVHRYQCLGHRIEGIDNPGLTLDGEDSKSISSREQKFNKAKSVITPVLLRRFQGGRTNAKYFISRHSDDFMNISTLHEQIACKKSSSTPNFANLIVKNDVHQRDIQSEGKPTPQAKRSFVKRQMSTRSLGKRPLRLAVYDNMCYSDGDMRREASLSCQDIFLEKRSRGVKDSPVLNKKTKSPTRLKKGLSSLSFLRIKRREPEECENPNLGSEQMDTNSCVSLTEKGNDEESDTLATPTANSNYSDTQSLDFRANDSELSLKGKSDADSLNDQQHEEKDDLQQNVLSNKAQNLEEPKTMQIDASNIHQNQESVDVDEDNAEAEIHPPEAAVEFSVPQCDEGIDMSFEIETERDHSSGLALCPQCQSQFYLNDDNSNNSLLASASQGSLNNGIIAHVTQHTSFDDPSAVSVTWTLSSADILKDEKSHGEDSKKSVVASASQGSFNNGIIAHVIHHSGFDGNSAKLTSESGSYAGILTDERSRSENLNFSCQQLPDASLDKEPASKGSLEHAGKLPRSPLSIPRLPQVDLDLCDTVSVQSSGSLPSATKKFSEANSGKSRKYSRTKSYSESDTGCVYTNSAGKSTEVHHTRHRKHSSAPISSSKDDANSIAISESKSCIGPWELSPPRILLHQSSQLSDTNDCECTDSSDKMSVHVDNAQKHSSATSIAISVTTVFVLSFLPHLSLMLARALIPNFDTGLSGSSLIFYNIFLRSYLINAALNTFVYGFLNQQFRHECLQILRSVCHTS